MHITSDQKRKGSIILVTIAIVAFWVFTFWADEQDANRLVCEKSGSKNGSMEYSLSFAEGCMLKCSVSDSGTVSASALAIFKVYINESLFMTETVSGYATQTDYYDDADVNVWVDWSLKTSINSTIRVEVTPRSGTWRVYIYRGTQALLIKTIYLPLMNLSLVGLIIIWVFWSDSLKNRKTKKYHSNYYL